MDQAGGKATTFEGHAQSPQSQFGAQRIAQLPTDHAPRIGVEDHRQINELRLQPDVGDIGHPELINVTQHHFLGQIGIDGKAVP